LKLVRFLIKSFFYISLALSIAIFAIVVYLNNSLSQEYKIKKGDVLNIDTFVPVTAIYNGSKLSQNSLNNIGEDYDVNLKLFGVIPFSTVNVEVVDELQVAVLGTPFGMKIYTEGVLVTNISDVRTLNGLVNPAMEAGIKTGDYIVSVNGTKIYTNEDLSEIVENSNGNKMKFLIVRNNKKITVELSAALSSETNSYKIGIWIKDSSAGIGTLTFYSPATDVVCGLGHGICDEETGNLLTLNSGELVSAEIIGVEKGSVGSPGQLNGKFGLKALGNIDLNCSAGVYSDLKGKLDLSNIVELAMKHEVENGKGQIFCTVNGTKPKFYNCKISIRTSAFLSKTQNMIITVTDPELLSITGGIVQGMSGSPIIQNGKLIGAVTHVLVDDPTKGYGIFAENMLETAQSVAENNKFKDAS